MEAQFDSSFPLKYGDDDKRIYQSFLIFIVDALMKLKYMQDENAQIVVVDKATIGHDLRHNRATIKVVPSSWT